MGWDVAGVEGGGGAVFLFFHAAMTDTFRTPALFAGCSGDLRAKGLPSQVIETWLELRDPARTRATLDELSVLLRRLRPAVTVLQDVPDEGLFARIRGDVDGAVVLAEAGTHFPDGTVDWLVHHAATHPGLLSRAVKALLRGGSPGGLPNVARVGAQGPETPAGGFAPCADAPVFEADPDTAVVTLPAGWTPPSRRVSVYVNAGCPYGADARLNPFFQGADLSAPTVAVRGCAFCFMGGDYRGLSPEASVDRVVRELKAWRRARPDLDEAVLWDESPYRYLPALVRRLRVEGLVPMRLCLHGRSDLLARSRDRLEEACQAAGPADRPEVSLAVMLIGFESFSSAELQRLNKGLGPEEQEVAIRTCREIADAWPRTFAFDRYRSSSFILFTPWTTPADLRENISAFRRLGITDFATGMGNSKLRLYPNLPLHVRAAADGLLLGGYEDAALDAARRFGYAVEHPWRFADPVIGTACGLYARLYPRVERTEEVALLEWVLDRAEADPGLDADVEAARFDRLAALLDRVHRIQGGGSEVDLPGPQGGIASAELDLGATCNQGCAACMRDVRVFEPSQGRLEARIDDASRGARRLYLAGCEPTLSPLFLPALRRARSAGFDEVDVLTNGRLFAYPKFLYRAVRAGLTNVRVKLFGPDAARHDARTRTPGAFEDVHAALSNLRGLRGAVSVQAVLVVRPDTVADLDETRAMAREAGIERFRYLVPVATLPRSELETFLDTLEAHVARVEG